MKRVKIFLYTDGASRGNPGPGAIAVIIFDENGDLVEKYGEYIGRATNNEAEYRALIKGLELVKRYCAKEVRCFSDSEVLVRQLNGTYKIKKSHLFDLFQKVKSLEKGFEKISYENVRRTDPNIEIADKMVNQILDEKSFS